MTQQADSAQAAAAAVEGLEARTRPLPGPVDLLAVAGPEGVLFSRSGMGFAGRGVAASLDAADMDGVLVAAEALRAVPVDDEVDQPGTGPVAFGALPFRPTDPSRLVVPEVLVGVGEGGDAWLTEVRATGQPWPAEPHDLAGGQVPGPRLVGPGGFTVRALRPPDEWCEAVATATRAMREGRLDKVVLAREVEVQADAPFAVEAVLTRLRAAYPDCFVFHVDGFLGASPELLVARHDQTVRAQPMAGTAPRRGDPAEDARQAEALFADPTYRHEHQVTIEWVHEALLPFCSYLDEEAEPSITHLANVMHLATWVEGRLSLPLPSVLELVRALHPTPAVCGRPRDAALALIGELEGGDRGRYAGAVGWVDRAGNGEWAVSLRCAEVSGAHARMWGGNGIVADSDPATELVETRAKLQAMLGALIRP